jgi:hypothetical protein
MLVHLLGRGGFGTRLHGVPAAWGRQGLEKLCHIRWLATFCDGRPQQREPDGHDQEAVGVDDDLQFSPTCHKQSPPTSSSAGRPRSASKTALSCRV